MSNNIIKMEERGIEIFKVEEDIKPEKLGYKKVPEKMLPSISLLSSHVAGEIVRSSNKKNVDKVLDGAYKAIIKDGTHFGKSSTTKGAIKGLLFSDEGNVLMGQADWIKIDGKEILRSTQLISGVFSAMALVSGQYHLSEINKRLDSLGASLNDIYDFLKNDKASSIKADNITLINICRDIEFIMSNEFEKRSVSTELKSIKRNSLRNIEFFKTSTRSVRAGLRANIKAETFKKKMEQQMESYPQYWCSILNYALSESLDAMISGMDSSEYLTIRYIDLMREIMLYEDSIEKTSIAAKRYINNSKELNKKGVIPKDVVEVINAFPTFANPAALGVKAVASGAKLVDEALALKSKEKRIDAEMQEAELYNSYADCTPLKEVVRQIEEYRISRNSEVEILRYKGNYYVKYNELQPPEK